MVLVKAVMWLYFAFLECSSNVWREHLSRLLNAGRCLHVAHVKVLIVSHIHYFDASASPERLNQSGPTSCQCQVHSHKLHCSQDTRNG